MRAHTCDDSIESINQCLGPTVSALVERTSTFQLCQNQSLRSTRGVGHGGHYPIMLGSRRDSTQTWHRQIDATNFVDATAWPIFVSDDDRHLSDVGSESRQGGSQRCTDRTQGIRVEAIN